MRKRNINVVQGLALKKHLIDVTGDAIAGADENVMLITVINPET